MDSTLNTDQQQALDPLLDYTTQIITLRQQHLQHIEQHISSLRHSAEHHCDELHLQLQCRLDSLTSSTLHNIDKLINKKSEDLQALKIRLARQKDILREQEQLLDECGSDADVVMIITSLRKNVSSIEKSIAGRDKQVESECEALREQLKMDTVEMETLVNNQCVEVRSRAEESLTPVKALLRLERHKLAVEMLTVDEAVEAGVITNEEVPFSPQHMQSLQLHSPVKKPDRSNPPHTPSKNSSHTLSKKSSPSKRASPIKKATGKIVSSPSTPSTVFLTPAKSTKTGYSISLEAAKRSLLSQGEEDEAGGEEEARRASAAIQFQKAVDIVNRYHLRGNVLPRPRNLKLPTSRPSASTTKESNHRGSSLSLDIDTDLDDEHSDDRDQEYKDAINLDRWKQSLRSDGKEPNGLKSFGFCPDEVRDFLDVEMPSWRDSRWTVNLGQSVHD
jgi:hypothetical protein